MSMKLLTILQTTEAFVLYMILTVLLPSLVFSRKFKHFHFTVRFFLYFVIGNFYIINLVYILQLIHISNRFTLIAGTALPAALVLYKSNSGMISELYNKYSVIINKIYYRQMRQKTLRLKIRRWCRSRLKRFFKWFWQLLHRRILDILLVTGLTVLMLWLFGSNLLTTYGYTTSDMPIHNYWINYLGKNEIFVAGVYPYGFHCVIYFIHEVFGMDTFVLLRVFWMTQTFLIHFVLLAFLKYCCKSRYSAYIGVGCYIALPVFLPETYSRFFSTLPQEFGMLFILPSICFAIAFFKERKIELELRIQDKWGDSKWYLLGFAMSFSMTFSIHFYNMMIAGLFCAGIAIGYFFRFFRKGYFGRVVITFVLSMVVAILPMGIAYVTGTPLESSLYWGMGVMSGEVEGVMEEEISDETHIPEEGTEVSEEAGIINRLKDIGSRAKGHYYHNMYRWVLDGEIPFILNSVFVCMVILLLAAIVCFVLKRTDYGALLISVDVYMLLMSVLLISGKMGIPELMDASRCGIFYNYSLPILWALALDSTLYVLLGGIKKKMVLNIISLVCAAAIGIGLVSEYGWKKPMLIDGLQRNEAVTCLTNIIYENDDFKWTIVSANDETRMGEDHGYHYETIDFLRGMENSVSEESIALPTKMVYFFIEKVTIDYGLMFKGSGQAISEEGAAMALPDVTGIFVYTEQNRWIVMSRMYYWAQEFRKLYPNEFKVYYETDDFVCYYIEQNEYQLYHFAIDYGYNMAYGK